jgi:mycothiol system anti-sigma-R factor
VVDCNDFLKQVDFYLSGELSAEEARRVAQHLVDCWDCGDRVESHIEIREILARKCSETTSEDLVVRIRSVIQREMDRGPGTSRA